MKKNLLSSLLTCAVALSACTSEDVVKVGPQSNVITFRNVVNKSSRALDSDNFNRFFIYGYYTKGTDLNTRFSIFTDTPVIKSVENKWSSAISRYWVSGANYKFYAFSCENKDIAASFGGASVGQSDGVFRINYTCHTDDGNSHDLIFASATATGKAADNEPVTLQFKHILSKISLRFISDFPEGYQVEVSNIKISDFENMGTFTASTQLPSEGTWDGVKYDKTVLNSYTLNTIGSNITSSDKDADGNYINPPIETSPCFMVPNRYLAVSGGDNPVKIQFDIKLINPKLGQGNQIVASNTLVGSWHPNWRQGTQYVYSVHLSGNEAGMDRIEFNVGVSDWNNPESDNVPEKINISLDYVLSQASSEGE